MAQIKYLTWPDYQFASVGVKIDISLASCIKFVESSSPKRKLGPTKVEKVGFLSPLEGIYQI